MGILTYLKIGGLVALLLAGGYFYLDYRHAKNKVLVLEQEIGNLKLSQEALDERAKKFEQFMAKRSTAARKINREQVEITKDVPTIDGAGLDKLYERYRMRPQDQVQPPTPRRKGGSSNAPVGSP